MVGVLNGKKKAFSVVVVAFLVCGVFGGLVVEQGLGDVGDKGFFGQTVGSTDVTFGADIWVGSAFSLDVDANVTDLHAYLNNWGSALKVFIYSLDGKTCYYHSDSSVQGSGLMWHNFTGVDTVLASGQYILGYRLEGAYNCYKVAGNGMNGSVGYSGAWGALAPTYNNYCFAVYANYTECSVEGGELELSMGISSWGGLAVSVFLIAICLVLALKSKSWAVNFLIGLGTVGFLGWVFANATVEVYGGWLMYMVLLSAVLALTKGAVLVRASGV